MPNQQHLFSQSYSIVFVNLRLTAAVLHLKRVNRSEHEGSLPPQHDGGTASPARRFHGRANDQLTHDEAVRRISILHERHTLTAVAFEKVSNSFLSVLIDMVKYFIDFWTWIFILMVQQCFEIKLYQVEIIFK